MNGFSYSCPMAGENCPIHKKCFVLKTVSELDKPIDVYHKCAAEGGNDIRISIGKRVV